MYVFHLMVGTFTNIFLLHVIVVFEVPSQPLILKKHPYCVVFYFHLALFLDLKNYRISLWGFSSGSEALGNISFWQLQQ